MKKLFKVFLIITAVSLVIGFIVAVFSPEKSTDKPAAPTARQIADSIAELHRTNLYLAYEATREAVTKSLKAPSTAKFQSYTDAKLLRTTDSTYQVQLWVDAQNSYGAMLRNTYAANFRYSKGKLIMTEIFEMK